RPVFLIANPDREQRNLLRALHKPRVFIFVGARRGRCPIARPADYGLNSGDKPQLPTGGAFQQYSRYEEPVNFVGTFEDPVDSRITVSPFHRIILMVAIAAVD